MSVSSIATNPRVCNTRVGLPADARSLSPSVRMTAGAAAASDMPRRGSRSVAGAASATSNPALPNTKKEERQP